MTRCEVLVVGGGPAGSSCARRLVAAGLDVLVIDRARFPRDKVCAGWITPAVVRALDLDLSAYAAGGLTLQPFTAFRTGVLGGRLRTTDFAVPISYGIRRCEFDTYLLRQSGAATLEGEGLSELHRDGRTWVVNRSIRADMLVGAGGHFCPVARHLNHRPEPDATVAAQEIEFRLDAGAAPLTTAGHAPELFFWPDLRGYGWCVRKGEYLNVGAGRLGAKHLPSAMREFARLLSDRDVLKGVPPEKWKGHAYLLNRTSARRVAADGVLLVGDAAGLALAPSGEGILAAIESGLLAADALVEAKSRGSWSRAALGSYARAIDARFGARAAEGASPVGLPPWLAAATARTILRSRWLTRHVLIEDWFLHRRRPDLPVTPRTERRQPTPPAAPAAG
jgi:flavin-dependent dehydrogenase